MNLSFDMDIEDKEGQVPDRSISKLFRCMILHDLKTIVHGWVDRENLSQSLVA